MWMGYESSMSGMMMFAASADGWARPAVAEGHRPASRSHPFTFILEDEAKVVVQEEMLAQSLLILHPTSRSCLLTHAVVRIVPTFRPQVP
jgi:hypothetical protein